jgi:hypothetical protein
MTADRFADLRPALDAALTRTLDSLSSSHVVLLSHQLEGGGSRDAGLLCLAAADALGAPDGAAEPAAVALTLLDAMGATFEALDRDGAPLGRYGMPRSLNAGDGFYALAQSALLHAAGLPDAAQHLAAVELLDQTCNAYADELHARLQADYAPRAPALTPAALAFAALAAGASTEAVRFLAAGDLENASLPAEARARIEAALQSPA